MLARSDRVSHKTALNCIRHVFSRSLIRGPRIDGRRAKMAKLHVYAAQHGERHDSAYLGRWQSSITRCFNLTYSSRCCHDHERIRGTVPDPSTGCGLTVRRTTMAKLPLYAAGIAASFTILLTAAAAEDAALLKQAQEMFERLPQDLDSAEFPITRERVELGRSLFFDPRLTVDGNMSCSSCHQPAFYGTDALPRAIGVKQRPHPRNAPTVLNSGALNIIHWRGDRESLEDQVAKAVTSPITSGQPDEKAILDRLSRVSGYAPL